MFTLANNTNSAVTTGTWNTTTGANGSGNTFLSGLAFLVPAGGIKGGSVQNIVWSGEFTTDTKGATAQWQWAAAVYSGSMSTLLPNGLGVKPCDSNQSLNYNNSDHAGVPEAAKSYGPLGGARGGGGSNWTGSYSSTGNVTPCLLP